MSLNLKGSFGPITGAMKAGDAAPSIPTLAGLTWETNLVDGSSDGFFNIIDNSTVDLASTVNMVGERYQVGMVSEPVVGDFNFSLDMSMTVNGGFYTLSVLDVDKNYIWTPTGEDYLLQIAAWGASLGGAVVSRKGYLTYAWNTGALSQPTTMTVQRTGGANIQGIGANISSDALSYSDPVRLLIGYVKATANGNTGIQETITANNVTLS